MTVSIKSRRIQAILYPFEVSLMRKTILFLSIFSMPLMSCSLVLDHLPYVYKIDVNQGNMIDQSMIDQLRPNMTKRQILYIMGTPMLVDYFHQNRWDYIYSSKKVAPILNKKQFLFFLKMIKLKVFKVISSQVLFQLPNRAPTKWLMYQNVI